MSVLMLRILILCGEIVDSTQHNILILMGPGGGSIRIFL